MTDSMKFGPEWLRNMSAEPASANNNVGGSIGGTGSSSSLSIHSLTDGGSSSSSFSTQTTTSRNMFPEYRYGREEMLSLFERNCVLPQILPTFKKLFVEKVQYPLALTPSSEDDINNQTPPGSNSRPSWLQRSTSGFGPASRVAGRGNVVERGRIRGKSIYHPIYQRPNTLYDDGISPVVVAKSERNWSERNGDPAALGASTSSGLSIDWNGTPNSSPRKEFSNNHRNMENWRRNRNEDGPGDGQVTVGASTPDGWRNSGGFGNSNHRWGRSTSWRDEDSIQTLNSEAGTGFSSGINMQRSLSTMGTIGSGKATAAGCVVNAVTTNRQIVTSKSSQSWSSTVPEADDNLPEWAMENPSEVGGTFDSSGAFHGESGDDELQKTQLSATTQSKSKDALVLKEQKILEPAKEAVSSSIDAKDDKAINVNSRDGSAQAQSTGFFTEKSDGLEIPFQDTTDAVVTEHTKIQEHNHTLGNGCQTVDAGTVSPKREIKENEPASHGGDMAERFKEVADEVEKLIMDDDGGVVQRQAECRQPDTSTNPVVVVPSTMGSISGRYGLPGGMNVKASAVLDSTHQQAQHTESAATTHGVNIMPFTDQLALQQHIHHHHRQQQHLAQSTSAGISPHVLNTNSNDLWFYRDPQSNVQGPFSAIEMSEWYRAGYFNENLFVRRFADSRFRPLGELTKLCHGNMPFTHSHLLPSPIDLDNLSLNSNKSSTDLINDELQQQHQHERSNDQLKASVTAAADSLSAVFKEHISPMNTAHTLAMHFQMLQDQYMQHQEYQIHSELSKNECFQRLTVPEREAIVRRKVQLLGLPDYLSSLSGLSSSLAMLNPVAGNQLYDAIAEQTKDNHHQQQLFAGGSGDQSRNFLEADDFIMNAQLMHQQSQATHTETAQQFAGDGIAPFVSSEANKLTGNPGGVNVSSVGRDGADLLNEYNLRMMLRGGSGMSNNGQQVKVNSAEFMSDPRLLSASNLMMPMWMPRQQTQDLLTSAQAQAQQQQPWRGHTGPLVGLANEALSQKLTSSTLWDVSTLEEEQCQQLLHQKHQLMLSGAKSSSVNPNNLVGFDGINSLTRDNQSHEKDVQLPLQSSQHMLTANSDSISISNIDQQQLSNVRQEQLASQRPMVDNVKQSNKQPQQPQVQKQLSKQVDVSRVSEEDRRKEQADEKKRLKEERRRQQIEDEKRRNLLVEEEKSRQIQEEKERQQQIQAQRRKALLGTSTTQGVGSSNKTVSSKAENQMARTQTASIAPWSLQAPTTNSGGPGLAEIQKAERRERRADQQRQQEQLDKQMRATAAAAAEASDALIKWQAGSSPAPVMNLADIQAEESKRLANDLIEQQRRREQEQQQQATLSASLNVSSGLSNIWGSTNKAWNINPNAAASISTTATSFWEEPIQKFSNNTAIVVSGATSAYQSPTPNITKTQMKAVVSPSNRNIRKSQTVPAMQHTLTKTTKVASIQQQDKNKPVTGKFQKISSDLVVAKTSTSVKSQPNNDTVNNKMSEFENEFTSWCMKSLATMSAKVDVPTFVSFLQDLEAPYEVKDYVRIYLGEGKESADFAKQFLEKRSKYKNLQRAQNAHNDDMCKPAPAITPSLGSDNSDNKNKSKKIKKNKMTKMDAARILGFSVTAAEGRINVGVRDYGDGP